MNVFGHTRSKRTRDYALITPDTHVHSPLVGWKNASAVIHISPEMGARFLQYTATMEAASGSASPGQDIQRFVYVLDGQCKLTLAAKADESHVLSAGHFAFLPANVDHELSSVGVTSLFVIEKKFVSASYEAPEPVIANSADVSGEPFMGDPDARLQTLLPIDPKFDMAVNIFTYQPGATLPQVEQHVMEHGLLMLAGQGVYRLVDDYHPVAAGDIIWMASYCPQWFVAMGKQPASYIYHKDIHRDRLTEKVI